MKNMQLINKQMISPCGMNCATCGAHLREKNKCPGCRGPVDEQPKHCVSCVIKNCEQLKSSQSGYCYDCEKFPCRRLKQLDSRYRRKYKMSMILNLEIIKKHGIDKFMQAENKKWICEKCGAVISVLNKGYCNKC